MLKRLVLQALLVLLGCGCGAPDRPAPSDPMVTTHGGLDPGVAGGPAEEACEALSWRDCKITYTDESGQVQCPTVVQICNETGTAWLECGAYVYDETGTPRHRDTH